jgi:hypothetical protein
MTQHRGAARSTARFRPAHIVGLFLFYSVLTFAVIAFVFFFLFTGLEFRLAIPITLAIGLIATVVHVKAGRRTRVDTLVDKGP